MMSIDYYDPTKMFTIKKTRYDFEVLFDDPKLNAAYSDVCEKENELIALDVIKHVNEAAQK